MHTEKMLGQQQMFKGKIVELWHDRVELENGREALREVVRHPGAVGVLVRSGDSLAMVRQFRYAVGLELLEIPAGKLEPGEPPQEAALRELREETGIEADRLTFLGDYYASPGILSEVIHLYYTRPTGWTAPSPDEDEFVTARLVPIAQLAESLGHGEISDGKTIAAYAMAKARGLLD